ncbi:MAG: ArsA family ATPase [Chloroflexi bacterium]|nr:ArsA family ATPase [Chloroflexota bacterium]
MANTYHQPTANDNPIIMFVGKGGVGKTTCAAATALNYAFAGEQTLAISTDPTPSLLHIFEVDNQQESRKILDYLYLRELGMPEIKEMWDKKFGREVYEVFSSLVSIDYAQFVDFITQILPGLGDEFMVDYIRELHKENQYSRIIWDTAPLGQTLGLLQMPAMLGRHLKTAPRVYSRLKLGRGSKKSILDIIKDWERLSGEDLHFLKRAVRFIMVTIPEALAVRQLDRIFAEFDKYELKIERLIINNIIKDEGSEFLLTKAEQQREYIKFLHDRYSDMKIVEIPMFPQEIKGMERLRTLGKYLLE